MDPLWEQCYSLYTSGRFQGPRATICADDTTIVAISTHAEVAVELTQLGPQDQREEKQPIVFYNGKPPSPKWRSIEIAKSNTSSLPSTFAYIHLIQHSHFQPSRYLGCQSPCALETLEFTTVPVNDNQRKRVFLMCWYQK
ncbi:hypothetical protein Trydic_g11149 [Trypoxylus dichotomus]